MSEFNWWLLIVGLVVGAGLVWLVLADSTRRESEVEARELPAEAAWIAEAMADQGRPIDRSDAEAVLRLHRDYLAAPPPDDETALEASATDAQAGDAREAAMSADAAPPKAAPAAPSPAAPSPSATAEQGAAQQGEPAA